MARATSKSKSKPAAKASAKPASKASAKPAAKASAKPASKAKATSKPDAKSKSALATRPATSSASDALPFGGFGPPGWGHRPAAPLAFAKTGDGAVDAATAAFVAKPLYPALKKIHKVAKPAHARVLLAGPMLDLGDAYEPSAAELAPLDKKLRRNRYKVLLDFCNQTARGQLFVYLVKTLCETPEDRARLVALASDPRTPRSGRSTIVGWLEGNETSTVDDVLALGRALRRLGWIGETTQRDGAFSSAVTLGLFDDPEATVTWIVPLLVPGGPRGAIGSVLDGIEAAFSDNPNNSDAQKALAARLDRKALAPLVAPIRALVDDPDVGERARTALAALN